MRELLRNFITQAPHALLPVCSALRLGSTITLNLEELDSDNWEILLTEATEWKHTRYTNVPESIKSFMCSFRKAITIDGKSWFLSYDDHQSGDNSGFTSDEFEKVSLEAAKDDAEWCDEIKLFWDNHLPIYMSVRNGYEYIAFNLQTSRFVEGSEPEFEETVDVASNTSELIDYINEKNT